MKNKWISNKNQKKINKILYYHSLLFVSKAIYIKLISFYYNNPLADHIDIEKTYDLLEKKYYRPTFWYNIKVYIKSFNIYLVSKIARYKFYNDFQSLLVPIY